jgi:hypothetical protein
VKRGGWTSDGQYRLRSTDPDRLWSRLPERTGDPIESPDGCRDCGGTGLDLSVDPPCPCGPCFGTGWQP